LCAWAANIFRDGALYVRQQKTGAELIIPVHAHLQAIHASLREISCYTKAADQKRLAEAAMGKAKARTSSG
jgi:hypothetical protein